MNNHFRRIFFPTKEEQEEDERKLKELHNEQAKEKGCSTCKNHVHVYSYPGFVIAEECECNAGLKCDTVCYSIINCPKWKDSWNDCR